MQPKNKSALDSEYLKITSLCLFCQTHVERMEAHLLLLTLNLFDSTQMIVS